MTLGLNRFIRHRLAPGVGAWAAWAAWAAIFAATSDAGLFPFDDSYITLAAARNLLERGTLAVDPAAPWFGITSPLHVILTALVGALVGVEAAARLVGVAAHLALVLGADRLARTWSGDERAGGIAALGCAVSGFFALHSQNGLETTFFAALAVWVFALHRRDAERRRVSFVRALVVASAILTRPEGWLILLVTDVGAGIAAIFRREGRAFARALVGGSLALVLAAPLLLIQLSSTMSLFPTTAAAKAAFFQLVAGDRALRSAGSVVLGLFKVFGRHAPWTILAALALVGRSRVRAGPAVAFAALFFALYAARFPAGLQMYWIRYAMPVLALLIVAGAVGLSRRIDGPRRRVVLAVMTGFVAWDAAAGLVHYRGDVAQVRDAVIPTVRWLDENADAGDLVAAHDIGALWYFGRARVMDTVGLTDPIVARANARDIHKRLLWEEIRKREPVWLIMFDAWNRTFFRLDAAIESGVLEKAWESRPGPRPDQRYIVYRCRWEKSELP